ncbi:putative tellurite resistance protein B-like protein [Rhodobium orientis]|uniref:Co-chaperone DjlA N-terminal domain-containing protein n=1 Tax=Rhodobium orientis TaxID=34017 RepID=A0A327JPW4_9HYPH|nr:TerB family tellurite resistance protein [Rhodobium orientis]MBB4303712.1 putative tellurite resistance protein B-like protein [Rhodobium orientis]MBK5951833.1 hypothetical protein [Rhodobium orientis]RAI28500.1 hypothetical protein CH339_06335 [Rhodobium orientis]
MFESLKQFLTDITQGQPADESSPEKDQRLAVAALLVHLVSVDGIVADSEKQRLKEILRTNYNLSPKDTEALISEARTRDREAIDLYAFTSVLKRTLADDERRHVVEMMWEIVYADGTVHEMEDNIVWRVAELLGVSSRDRIAMRKRVEGRIDDEGE